ncbi:MAG: hypothetical protein JXO51_03130, partial [Candidatus Aminicenantes bacterium]|nr:hypothetical protein [Candidatus Aminicenantes bacterium]
LSNMIDDETIRNFTMGDYPQEAADALVKLANDHGGTDNITVQVIRLGSLETMEKTKPIRLSRPRRKLVSLVSLLVLLLILVGLWYVFLSPDPGDSVPLNGSVAPAAIARTRTRLQIAELESSALGAQGLTAADCLFLSGGRLHVVRNRRLSVFRLADPEMRSFELSAQEQVIPSASRGGEIYLLRREPTESLGYQLVRHDLDRTMLRVRAGGELNSKESQPGSVPLYKIAGLRERIVPDFINEDIFVFHDTGHYYQIANWRTADGLLARIGDLAFSPEARLFVQGAGSRTTLLYHDAVSGRTALFSAVGIVQKVRELRAVHLGRLLLMEYDEDRGLLCYTADQCVEMRDGEPASSHRYVWNNLHMRLAKVLLDMVDGRKLAVNDGNRFFAVSCAP